MATLAANKPRTWELGELNDLPVIATDIIYEGAAVGDNGSGYMRPLVSGDPFRGFALKKADNAAGAAGDIKVHLQTEGRAPLPVAGASALTDVGKAVYATDDDTFTLTAGGSRIGYVKRWVESTTCIVQFKDQQLAEAELNDIVLARG